MTRSQSRTLFFFRYFFVKYFKYLNTKGQKHIKIWRQHRQVTNKWIKEQHQSCEQQTNTRISRFRRARATKYFQTSTKRLQGKKIQNSGNQCSRDSNKLGDCSGNSEDSEQKLDLWKTNQIWVFPFLFSIWSHNFLTPYLPTSAFEKEQIRRWIPEHNSKSITIDISRTHSGIPPKPPPHLTCQNA